MFFGDINIKFYNLLYMFIIYEVSKLILNYVGVMVEVMEGC